MDGRRRCASFRVTVERMPTPDSPFLGSASSLTPQRLRGKAYKRVTRDVYVLADRDLDLRTRVQAMRTVFPEAAVCDVTAAALLRLPVDDDGLVHLDRGPGASRTVREGVKVHRLGIPPERVHDLDGIPVADGPRLFADLAAQLDLEALVALGDQVLRRWSAEDVDAAVEAHGRRRGAVLLARAVPLLDKGADSPPETRARLRLHAAGFTRLQHQLVIRDAYGGWLARPDLGDPVAKVTVQHEGAVHFLKRAKQRAKDVARDELARQAGWEVVVSTAIDDARPDRLIAKVESAYLRQARVLGPLVLPCRLR